MGSGVILAYLSPWGEDTFACDAFLLSIYPPSEQEFFRTLCIRTILLIPTWKEKTLTLGVMLPRTRLRMQNIPKRGNLRRTNWYRVSHYFSLIRFKASLDYLDKLPKNLQYGQREIFSTDSRRSSGIPTRHSCCPINISPISRMQQRSVITRRVAGFVCRDFTHQGYSY